MMFKTHLAVGFLAGLFAITYLHPGNQILFMFLVLLGSALPDIDHPESKVGKRFKPFNYLLEHRGFFHSLFALVLVFIIAKLITNNQIMIGAVLIGYLSHILADILNEQGIMPFHPFSRFRLSGFIKTNTTAEFIVFLIISALGIYKLLHI